MSENIKNKLAAIIRMSALKGSGALYYVAGSDNHICAKSLIEAGVDVNQRNFEGNPPLEHAVRKGQLEMVKILLNKGAIHNNSHFVNSVGPLHIAAKYCWPEIVQLLIKVGADVNARDNKLRTPLHLVNEYRFGGDTGNRCKIIRMLLSAGANVNAKDFIGATPLEKAISHSFCAGFELMLSMVPEIGDEKNRSHYVYMAMRSDSLDIFKRLIELGFVNLSTVYSGGNTCLHMAAKAAGSKIVEYLLCNGAEADALNKDGFDSLYQSLQVWLHCYRNRPLSCQCKEVCHENVIQQTRCLELLIKHGANMNTAIKNQLTPLYMVLQDFGHPSDFLRILLKNGAKFDFEHPLVNKVMNDKDGSKFAHLLLIHTALYVAQDRTDVPANFYADKLNKELREDYQRCRDELDLMKTTKFEDTEVSCFHVLVNKDIFSSACINNIVREFEALDVPKRFPIYSDLLTERFFKEVKSQQLLRAGEALSKLFAV